MEQTTMNAAYYLVDRLESTPERTLMFYLLTEEKAVGDLIAAASVDDNEIFSTSDDKHLFLKQIYIDPKQNGYWIDFLGYIENYARRAGYRTIFYGGGCTSHRPEEAMIYFHAAGYTCYASKLCWKCL